METPEVFRPRFAVYVSETAQQPLMAEIMTQQEAIRTAERHGLRTFVIRRQTWTPMGYSPRGFVCYTRR